MKVILLVLQLKWIKQLFVNEKFGTRRKRKVFEAPHCSHYKKNFDKVDVPIRNTKAKALLFKIIDKFGILAFVVDRQKMYSLWHTYYLKALFDAGVDNAFPPLNDISGQYMLNMK